jgi:hypothetical protein
LGLCHHVPDGQDPLDQCTDVTSTNPCGTDGFCDGTGACRLRICGPDAGSASDGGDGG